MNKYGRYGICAKGSRISGNFQNLGIVLQIAVYARAQGREQQCSLARGKTEEKAQAGKEDVPCRQITVALRYGTQEELPHDFENSCSDLEKAG